MIKAVRIYLPVPTSYHKSLEGCWAIKKAKWQLNCNNFILWTAKIIHFRKINEEIPEYNRERDNGLQEVLCKRMFHGDKRKLKLCVKSEWCILLSGVGPNVPRQKKLLFST